MLKSLVEIQLYISDIKRSSRQIVTEVDVRELKKKESH